MGAVKNPMDSGNLDTGSVAGCLVDAWRYVAGQFPGHVLANVGPVAVTLSHTDCPFFNMITLSAPLESQAALRQAIATAHGYAEACPHDAMLLLSPDWLPANGAAILAEAGLAYSMSMWGMAAFALAPARRDEPALEFRFASDEATALDVGRVNADAYGMPHNAFAVTGTLPRWTGTQVAVVGYEDGRAVTAAQAYLLGAVIYIAMVATLPGLHGRGYGEAAMRRAIEAVQHVAGPKRLWLHATEMGRPLYRAMGFADGAQMDLYAFAPARA
ncbi:GNAT family N-acetyltransferase [Blastomonas sp.]|uniref:GNAT family N-acetyltransferase n=1 Tax=Blastomonas sp. TaxID=1909299 RepID=UPI0026294BC2|nr:GNAT family N-acetyltransferase [Blastomonas sp.]MDM7957559.1 GNAT family N-acetyltransferase [Blastomonas sp.]